jgi:epoxyqueuosine reductase QueG
MNKTELLMLATSFLEKLPDNTISEEIAISKDVVGLKIYEAPIFAVGNSTDAYFKSFKDPTILGSHFLLPEEWLPEAKTVISFFLPFTREVREGNKRDPRWPSAEWLHGRIEGHAVVNKLGQHLQAELSKAGYFSVIPTQDERFKILRSTNPSEQPFASNWSERHVAFVCGLGTFGLSKGLITPKGMSGRLGSLVTNLPLSADERHYSEIYEYCSMCGACVKQCPVAAISIETGKNHQLCSDFLDQTTEKFSPRYGCGKCQVNVPCESQIPRQKP